MEYCNDVGQNSLVCADYLILQYMQVLGSAGISISTSLSILFIYRKKNAQFEKA